MTAGPIRVAIVELDDPIVELDCAREASPPYTHAWVLACRSGRPLGIVEVPLRGASVPAGQLEEELRRRLGSAWFAQPDDQPPVALPATVVVASNYTRPVQLQRCVESLVRLEYPGFEVIVVDNRPIASPPMKFTGARVVHEPRPGASAARNAGLAVATGEIVAFTDDDVEVDRHWLTRLAGRFARQPEVAAVTGLVVPRELETQAQIWFEQSGSGPDRGFEALTFERAGRFRIRRGVDGADAVDDEPGSLYATGELGLGSNLAFRASVLRGMGGFDRALGPGTLTCAGEDLAVLLELLVAGHRLAYEPSAIVHHNHRSTLSELEHQVHSYGVGFTAMLTALSLRNPRHLLGLAAVVPAWLRSLRAPASGKGAQRGADYPGELVRTELRGMLVGPVAYLRSRRRQNRWAS